MASNLGLCHTSINPQEILNIKKLLQKGGNICIPIADSC